MDEPRLLLFDDEKNNAEVTIDIFEDEFKVDWASSYEELDKMIKTHKYGVIVTDVMIDSNPKLGYELVDELRKKYRLTRIPVVVYSAVADVDQIRADQGKLFHSYVNRMNRDQLENLLNACNAAIKDNQHTVSWDTLEASFEKIGKLDEHVPKSDIPEAFAMGIYFDKDPTVRILIGHARNSETDGTTWDVLEGFLQDLYNRYTKSDLV